MEIKGSPFIKWFFVPLLLVFFLKNAEASINNEVINDFSMLENRVADLEEKLKKVMSPDNADDDHVRRLVINVLENLLKPVSEEYQKVSSGIDKVNDSLKRLEVQQYESIKNITELKKDITGIRATFRSEIENTNKVLKTFRNEIGNSKQSIDHLGVQINSSIIQQQITNSKISEFETESSKTMVLQQRLQSIEDTQRRTTSKLLGLETDVLKANTNNIKSFKDLQNKTTSDISGLQKGISRAKTDVLFLNLAHWKTTSQILELHQEISEVKTNVQSLKDKQSETTSYILGVHNRSSEIKDDVKSLTDEQKKANSDILVLQNSISELKNDLTNNVKKVIDATKADLTEIQTNVKKTSLELEAAISHKRDLEFHEGGNQNQKWTPKRLGSNPENFQIKSTRTGKCIDNKYGNSSNGNDIIQWACSGGVNQRWVTIYNGTYFQLSNVKTKMCIGVSKGSNSDGTFLKQYTCGKEHDLWSYKNNNLINKGTGKCIDGPENTDGALVTQWTCN